MPGRSKCEVGCSCKKHSNEFREKISSRVRLEHQEGKRNYSGLTCQPGCACGHHTRSDFKECEPGCTCKRHEQTDEHRHKNSEGVRKAIAEGRKNTPEEIAKRTATRKAKGDWQTVEALEAMQEGRRRALAQGLIEPGSYLDGRSSHPHYTRWFNMVQRCTNPNHPSWRLYGARGITVCDDWLDPLVFYAYIDQVLGPCPVGFSIDRIDNDGSYEPGNVRWATASQQNTNRRRYSKKT